MMGQELPYWRLSFFYFCYFSVLGGVLPYWGPYLHQLGLGPRTIGLQFALLTMSTMFAPAVWGWLADRDGRRLAWIRRGCLLALGCFSLLLLSRSPWWLSLVTFGFGFFWNAVLPQFDALGLAWLGPRRQHHYARLRAWGSVGFLTSVLAMSLLFARGQGHWLPVGIGTSLGLLWFSSLLLRPAPRDRDLAAPGASLAGLWALLRDRKVVGFLLACTCSMAAHGAYFAFFSIYLEELGLSRWWISGLWGMAVLAEICLLFLAPRLLVRWTPRQLLLGCLALSMLRWSLVAVVAPGASLLPVLLFCQCLHAASFACYHATGIEITRRLFGASHPGQGQAIYSSFTFGLGAMSGSLASGFLWLWGPAWSFIAAAAMAAMGWLLVWTLAKGPPLETPAGQFQGGTVKTPDELGTTGSP